VQVVFLYPGDDAIDDLLFLIRKSHSSTVTSALGSSVSSQTSTASSEPRDVMWLYILAYQVSVCSLRTTPCLYVGTLR
jgi:hypothetical protein